MLNPLLPTGCYDVLPPFARQESLLSSGLLSVFESYGYEQVSPPLLEYSDNLLSGRGAALSDQIFRVMDPAALKVMGIRSDITLQIARIAASRLANAPRPLRLCYNGLIMRMKAEALKSDRQLRQAGIELIGAKSLDADAEVMHVAASSLAKSGINNLSIDICLPSIVNSLMDAADLDDTIRGIMHDAIAHKDVTAIQKLDLPNRDSLVALMTIVGRAEDTLSEIHKISLPDNAKLQINELTNVIEILNKRSGRSWPITLDLTENTSFGYHTGLCFSIFLPELSVEVGRGGRYQIESSSRPETATGFTLYVETLRHALASPAAPKRIMIQADTSSHEVEKLQQQGYVTLYALNECGNHEEQAQLMGCEAVYANGKINNFSKVIT